MRNRRGQFQIPYEMLRTSTNANLVKIFDGFIPHYIDNNYNAQYITYVGEHKDFKEIDNAAKATPYNVVVQEQGTKILSRRFEEIS